MKQKKIRLTLPNGTIVDALTPLIVSASRATDIPAFYCNWFFKRLEQRYVRCKNPYSGRDSYVSFDNMRFIVFWSKNPKPLLQYIPCLKEKRTGCYIHYTLNDYQAERLEPNVPPLDERIDTFKRLVDVLGHGSVVWRFDPLLLTDTIAADDLLDRIERIYSRLRGYAEKLVFSFADISVYRKVGKNLSTAGVHYKEWDENSMLAFSNKLYALNLDIELATCAESIDLSQLGIVHNKCIDPALICRLMPELQPMIQSLKTDKGQRPLCGCVTSKDIGVYNTCPHGCIYCYANSSLFSARRNFNLHKQNPENDSIL